MKQCDQNDHLVLFKNTIVFLKTFIIHTLLIKRANKLSVTKQLYFQTTVRLLNLNITYEISHALQAVGILFHLVQLSGYQMAFAQ